MKDATFDRSRRRAAAALAFGFGAAWARAQAGEGSVRALALLRPAAEGGAREGLVLALRHAQTEPGIGDPPGYRLDDCASQRNLSAEGRAWSRAAGDKLRAAGVRFDSVESSAWCRCRDTATLMLPQQGVRVWPALNSFFDDRAGQARQTAELRAALARLAPGARQLWVTHQVNISALAGEFTAMGEGLVLRLASNGRSGGGERVEVLARLAL
jgi:broad specificity phosphatase PhoE